MARHTARPTAAPAELDVRTDLRRRSLLIARLSEQLRSEVGDILKMAEFLSTADLDEERSTAARNIIEICQRQVAELSSIADFSELESNAVELAQEPFDLHTALRSSVANLAYAAEERGVGLRCYLRREVPRWVVGDEDRLRQVLNSLLTSVIRQSRGCDIAVYIGLEAARERSFAIRVTIADARLAPPKADSDGLFESIEVDPRMAAEAPVLGLGLLIVGDLLKLMGGSLGVDGRDEEGCAFWFTVSLEACEASSTEIAHASRHPILLISNDPCRTPRTLVALQRWGYQIEFEDQFSRLPQRLQGGTFSLVLIDHEVGERVATFAARPRVGTMRAVPMYGVPRTTDGGVDEEQLLAVVQRFAGSTRN